MSRLNTYTSHTLIPRNPTYMTTKKMVTIHSEDRDIVHWPSANEFEITLPESLTNVQSIQLEQIMLPNNFYNISEQLQNNIFEIITDSVQLTPCVVEEMPKSALIKIPDGFYDGNTLATLLSNVLTNTLGSAITVVYDNITNKITFKNITVPLVFGKYGPPNADCKIASNKVAYKNCEKFVYNYNDSFKKYIENPSSVTIVDFNGDEIGTPASDNPSSKCCETTCNNDYINNGPSYENYDNWGLPYNLGFARTTYFPDSKKTGMLHSPSAVATVQETFKARIGMVRSAPRSKPWVKAFVEMAAEKARLARVKQQNTPTNQ